MEKKEERLIERYMDHDDELRRYVEEHRRYEAAIAEMNSKVYLTPQEEVEKKNLQKKKLAGKERIFEILSKYRNDGTG